MTTSHKEALSDFLPVSSLMCTPRQFAWPESVIAIQRRWSVNDVCALLGKRQLAPSRREMLAVERFVYSVVEMYDCTLIYESFRLTDYALTR